MARRSADFGLSAVFFENRWGRQSAGQDLGKTHMNDAARLESRRGINNRDAARHVATNAGDPARANTRGWAGNLQHRPYPDCGSQSR